MTTLPGNRDRFINDDEPKKQHGDHLRGRGVEVLVHGLGNLMDDLDHEATRLIIFFGGIFPGLLAIAQAIVARIWQEVQQSTRE